MGTEGIVITNNSGSPVFYRSNASTNGNGWLRLKFIGTDSNRDAFGADVRVTTGDKTQLLHFNRTNAFMGQRESVLHVGLGTSVGTVDSVEVTWPSGAVQTVTDLAANSVHTITETTTVALSAPQFTQQPVGGSFAKGETVTLVAEATANPAPVYLWFKNGEPISGATRSAVRL